ncbi:MAG TPA: thiamine pyrophosphate-binding protein [Candidatus Dormibacteraeota bacterium]|nr:thiamine pyrophosphate-binding protein [Candidatus Dormibacteraeota bacterium]
MTIAVGGGSLLAGALKRGGVGTVFALAGGHVMPALDACVPAGIRVIDTRHEGAATFAAEGWALATGRPGFAVATAGPGFTNALSGLFDAGLWNVPMVLLGGRSGLRMAGQGAVADLDQRAIATPGVKWAATCYETVRIPRYVAEALYRARAGRPGAVYLEVPQDALAAEASPPPDGWVEGFPPDPPRSTAPAADLNRARDLLRRAERPLIVAGGGAFWSGAGEAIARLSEAAGIPVTTTSSARGLVPDGHPWCLGPLVHGGIALVLADVVLVLGSAFNANLGYGRPPLFNAQQQVIQVDVTGDGLGGNRRPDLGLVGDVACVAADLADGWAADAAAARRGWLAEARQLVTTSRTGWDQQVDEYEGEMIHAGAAAREVARFAHEVAGGAATLVADGGDALAWALAYFPAEAPGRFLSTTTALGTLGVGLPFALAARAARADEPVFLFAGDGSFGLSAMELDTAVRHDLPVVVVVSNNAGWGDVRHEFEGGKGYEGPRVAAELGFTRYDRLAHALGAHGEHVTRLDELRPALRRAHDSGGPAVVNVETDPAVECALLRIVSEMNLM